MGLSFKKIDYLDEAVVKNNTWKSKPEFDNFFSKQFTNGLIIRSFTQCSLTYKRTILQASMFSATWKNISEKQSQKWINLLNKFVA